MKKQNKILVMLLSIFLVAGLSACKKKEAPEPSIYEKISGDPWYITKIDVYDSNDNLISSTPYTDTDITFKSSGIAIYRNGNNSQTYTYEVYEDGDDTWIEFADTMFKLISLDDNNLTWRYNNWNGDYQIWYMER